MPRIACAKKSEEVRATARHNARPKLVAMYNSSARRQLRMVRGEGARSIEATVLIADDPPEPLPGFALWAAASEA